MTALEEGYLHSSLLSLGKKTTVLLLDQVDDMTAHPRHISARNMESIGYLEEMVKGIDN